MGEAVTWKGSMMAFGDLMSREFKLMLDETEFGTREDLLEGACEFWAAARKKAERAGIARLKKDPEFKDPRVRVVEFIDTKNGKIYHGDYALRRRREPDEKETKITLKKRHADWVLAFHNGISYNKALKDNKGKLVPKFEEDVKPFRKGKQRSLFSHSLTWEYDEKKQKPPKLNSVSAVDRLFPGFADAIELGDKDLTAITDPVDEVVLKTDRIRFRRDADMEVEAAVVAWYRQGKPEPAAVEFSYRYERPNVDNSGAAADAVALLQLLQAMKWHSVGGPTKTRWIYCEAKIVRDGCP